MHLFCENDHPVQPSDAWCGECGSRLQEQTSAGADAATSPAGAVRAYQPAGPGWYPATNMAETLRYWDGQGWTDKFAPMGPSTSSQQTSAQPDATSPAVETDDTEPVGYRDPWDVVAGGLSFLAGSAILYFLITQDPNNGEAFGFTLGIGFIYLIAMFALRLIKLIVVGRWR